MGQTATLSIEKNALTLAIEVAWVTQCIQTQCIQNDDTDLLRQLQEALDRVKTYQHTSNRETVGVEEFIRLTMTRAC